MYDPKFDPFFLIGFFDLWSPYLDHPYRKVGRLPTFIMLAIMGPPDVSPLPPRG